MGKPKALLAWDGRPLVAHQIHCLAGFGEVVLVLGCHASAIRAALTPAQAPGVRFVLNKRWQQGRSSSLLSGFTALQSVPEAVLVAAVDQPLDEGVVEALLAAFDPQRDTHAVPRRDGRRGHPLLLAGHLLPRLRELEGLPEGLRTWTRQHRATCREVPVASDGVLYDLNTPADYEAARR